MTQRVEVNQSVFFFYADDQATKEKWIGNISSGRLTSGRIMISPKIIQSSDEEKDDDSDD